MDTLSGSPRIVPDPVINTTESRVKLTEASASLKAPPELPEDYSDLLK